MKNNRIILTGYALKALAIILAAIAMALLLTSCGKAAEKTAVAIVIDKGANSQLADGAADAVGQACGDVLRGGGHLTIVGASSHPQVICDKAVKEPGNSTNTALENRYKKDAAFAEAREIDGWTPAAEEIDLLKSLKLAADALRSLDAQGCASRTIYVIAPGLSSAGLLDFTGRGRYGDLLAWDFDELIARIAQDTSSGAIEAEGLPDLSGIHVVWMGFGQTVGGSQAELSPDRVAQLKDLWTRILQKCGAKFDPKADFANCPVSDIATDHSALPKVTPVVFEETLSMSLVSFDENVLAFNPNEDTYRDGQAHADAVLAPYAESLIQTKAKVVVLGTTAREIGKESGARELGLRRAARVKGDLEHLGVDADQITICSAGFNATGVRIGNATVDLYHDNYNSDGSWNEDVARGNRAIHIIPASLAGDVIARFGE